MNNQNQWGTQQQQTQNNRPLPEGVRFFNRHQNAPDFVLASLVITLDELYNFAKNNPQLLADYQGKKQIKLQVLRSKEGKIYSVVDTYGTPAQTAQQPQQQQQPWGQPQQSQQNAHSWGQSQQTQQPQQSQQPTKDELPF